MRRVKNLALVLMTNIMKLPQLSITNLLHYDHISTTLAWFKNIAVEKKVVKHNNMYFKLNDVDNFEKQGR